MSTGDPRLAVVMITHNRRAEVLRSLAHLSELPERPRIVVVDNGSTDGTAASRTSASATTTPGGSRGHCGEPPTCSTPTRAWPRSTPASSSAPSCVRTRPVPS
jgi:hypothetical protein